MTKPEYIKEIEDRVIKLELYQKGHRQTQDDILVEQADVKRMVGEMHNCLIGDEYTRAKNGGLINEIDCLQKDVDKLKTWKTRIVAAGSVITGLFTFLATLIISQWHNFKSIIK